MDVRKNIQFVLLGIFMLACMSYLTRLRGKRNWSGLIDFPESQWDIPGECHQRDGGGRIPHSIHFVWNANHLAPHVLALIDSVARHMPKLVIKIHYIAAEEGAEVHSKLVEETFMEQVAIWKGVSEISVVVYDRLTEATYCTPFEKSQQIAKLALKDTADIVRLIVLWKEGGVFVDPEFLFMRDVLPLLDLTHGVVIAWDDFKETDKYPSVGDSFLAFPPGHMFVWAAMYTIRSKLDSLEDSLFPNRTVAVPILGSRPLGFAAFEWAHAGGATYFVSSPSTGGCPGPHDLIENRMASSIHNSHWLGLLRSSPKISRTSVYIFDRHCFAPVPWNTKSHKTVDVPLGVIVKNEKLECVSDSSSEPAVQALCNAYSINLGSTKNNMRVSDDFISHLRKTPLTLLGFIFEQTCLKVCDTDVLSDLAGGSPDN